MRSVNIHADFAMIQCTKNRSITSLSHPLCHPAIRRGSVNFYSIPPVPPLRGFTGGYHMPPRHTARLQDSARLRLPSSPLYDENLIWYTPQASAKMPAGCLGY